MKKGMTLNDLKEVIENTNLSEYGDLPIGTLAFDGINIDPIKKLVFHTDFDGVKYVLLSHD